jgi:hypothetical protein
VEALGDGLRVAQHAATESAAQVLGQLTQRDLHLHHHKARDVGNISQSVRGPETLWKRRKRPPKQRHRPDRSRLERRHFCRFCRALRSDCPEPSPGAANPGHNPSSIYMEKYMLSQTRVRSEFPNSRPDPILEPDPDKQRRHLGKLVDPLAAAMLKGLFYSEFHNTAGPVLVFQAPDEYVRVLAAFRVSGSPNSPREPDTNLTSTWTAVC